MGQFLEEDQIRTVSDPLMGNCGLGDVYLRQDQKFMSRKEGLYSRFDFTITGLMDNAFRGCDWWIVGFVHITPQTPAKIVQINAKTQGPNTNKILGEDFVLHTYTSLHMQRSSFF